MICITGLTIGYTKPFAAMTVLLTLNYRVIRLHKRPHPSPSIPRSDLNVGLYCSTLHTHGFQYIAYKELKPNYKVQCNANAGILLHNGGGTQLYDLLKSGIKHRFLR